MPEATKEPNSKEAEIKARREAHPKVAKFTDWFEPYFYYFLVFMRIGVPICALIIVAILLAYQGVSGLFN